MPGIGDRLSARVLIVERLDNRQAANVVPLLLVEKFARPQGDSFRGPPGPTDSFAMQGVIDSDIVIEGMFRQIVGTCCITGDVIGSPNRIVNRPDIDYRAAVRDFLPYATELLVWVKCGMDQAVKMRMPEIIRVGLLNMQAPDSTPHVLAKFLVFAQLSKKLVELLELKIQGCTGVLQGKGEELWIIESLTPFTNIVSERVGTSIRTFRTPAKTAAIGCKTHQTSVLVTDEPVTASTGANLVSTRDWFVFVHNAIYQCGIVQKTWIPTRFTCVFEPGGQFLTRCFYAMN